MISKNIYLLLKIVKTKRSIDALLRENLSFKEIGDITELAINSNLIKKSNNEILLTESGELILEKLTKEFKRINKAEWIEKEKNSQIKPHEKNFIFLPDQLDIIWDL